MSPKLYNSWSASLCKRAIFFVCIVYITLHIQYNSSLFNPLQTMSSHRRGCAHTKLETRVLSLWLASFSTRGLVRPTRCILCSFVLCGDFFFHSTTVCNLHSRCRNGLVCPFDIIIKSFYVQYPLRAFNFELINPS